MRGTLTKPAEQPISAPPGKAFPGGALIGCSAGFVNVPRIKGSHNAMETGIMAAEAAFEAVSSGRSHDELSDYQEAYNNSRVAKELKMVRNVKPLLSKFGNFIGTILGGAEMWMRTLGIGQCPKCASTFLHHPKSCR